LENGLVGQPVAGTPVAGSVDARRLGTASNVNSALSKSVYDLGRNRCSAPSEMAVRFRPSYTIGEAVAGIIEQGRLQPIMGVRLPLERGADALRLIETRGALGKVVLEASARATQAEVPGSVGST